MNTVNANFYSDPTQTVEGVIEKCTRVIERDTTVAGVGRKMRNPMLSIFLGEAAAAHIPEVQSVYFSCWSNQAQKLKSVVGAYDRDMIEDYISQTAKSDGKFFDKSIVRMAWFWDVMDDRFDEYFACVRGDFSMPIGVQSSRIFFIFCSQSTKLDQTKTEARVKKLIAWAQETGNHLVVLSDAAGPKIGLLDAEGIKENYRLAASILLIMNSSVSLGISDLGQNLTFAIESNTVWSAGYRACSKNFFDIIGISLVKIIEKYDEMARMPKSVNSIQESLCGSGNYLDFLDEMFQEVLEPLCPTDNEILFWRDVPYTETVASLENRLNGGETRKGGLFGSLFGNKARNVTPGDAIRSLGDFWTCCVDRYYINPVQKWLETAEGKAAVKDYMISRMAAVLTFNQMKTLLPAESRNVSALCDAQQLNIRIPDLSGYKSAAPILHEGAKLELKKRIYADMLRMLSDAMKELSESAGGFESLLNQVHNTLMGMGMDSTVVKAYGYHMGNIVNAHPDVLNKYIRPCKQESELLDQLEKAFNALVKMDKENVYLYSLQEDMEFRMKHVGAAGVVNIVSSCFNFDMSKAGRLQTYSVPTGQLFCIMNDVLKTLLSGVDNVDIGSEFYVNRSDRIERLFVYPVDPRQIIY